MQARGLTRLVVHARVEAVNCPDPRPISLPACDRPENAKAEHASRKPRPDSGCRSRRHRRRHRPHRPQGAHAVRRGLHGVAGVGRRRAAGAVPRRVGLVDPLDPQHPGAVAALRAVGGRHPRPRRFRHAAQAVGAAEHRRGGGRRPRPAVPAGDAAAHGRLLVRRPDRRPVGRRAGRPGARPDPDRRRGARPARRPARAVRQAAPRHERGRDRRRLPPELGSADVCRPGQHRCAGGPPAGREHQARPLPQPPLRRHRQRWRARWRTSPPRSRPSGARATSSPGRRSRRGWRSCAGTTPSSPCASSRAPATGWPTRRRGRVQRGVPRAAARLLPARRARLSPPQA